MSINNLIIKERLQLFLGILSDIVSFKKHQKEKEKEIQIPPQIKSTIQEVLSSKKVLNFFIRKNEQYIADMKKEGKKNIKNSKYQGKQTIQDKKKSENVNCFNQNNISTATQFFYSKNEVKLVNQRICLIMVDIIKSCLNHGREMKTKNLIYSKSFVLAKKKKINQDQINNRYASKEYITKESTTSEAVQCEKNYCIFEKDNSEDLNIHEKQLSGAKKKGILPILNTNVKEKKHRGVQKSNSCGPVERRKYYSNFTYLKKSNQRQFYNLKKLSGNFDYKNIFMYYNMLK